MGGAINRARPPARSPLTERPSMQQPQARDYVLLIVLGAIWGSSFMFIKLALATVPPLTIAAGRIMIGAAVLLALGHIKGHRLPREAGVWLLLAIISITGNAAPFFLIAWGETRLDSTMAAILMAFVPLVTVILAHVMTRDERLSWLKTGGVAVGFAGVYVLVGGAAGEASGRDLLAQGALLVAATSYAFSSLLARRLPSMPTLTTAMAVLLCSTILILPFSVALDRPWLLDPSAASVAAVIMLGLASTATGSLILFHLIRRSGATFVSLNNYLVPAFGALFGIALLDEAISGTVIAGFALILMGVYVSSIGGKARDRATRRHE